MDVVVFSRDDIDLIVELAGCSLDESPGSNWVQKQGGLPEYICQVARAIKRSGKTTSQAIAIAVSRMKKWATGAGVDKDTQAKAAKALAQWNAKRAKSKADNVKASRTGDDFVCLGAKSFNVDAVRRAFDVQQRNARRAWTDANPSANWEDGPGYGSVRELWTDHVIAEYDKYSDTRPNRLLRYDYTVDTDGEVVFDEPVEVKTKYVVVNTDDMAGAELSDAQILDMAARLGPCGKGATDTLLQLSARPTALEQVLAAAKRS